MSTCSIISSKRQCILFLLTALCAALVGCSSSPSARDGERAIQDRIKQESEGRIKLTKFKKTNGMQGELMGFKIYALDFETEIEFLEDCKWVVGNFGQQLSFATSKPVTQAEGGFWGQWMDNTVVNPGSLVRKGQQVQISGVIRFVKKEKGWAVEGVELRGTSPVAGSVTAFHNQPLQNASQFDESALKCLDNLSQLYSSSIDLDIELQTEAFATQTSHRRVLPADISLLRQVMTTPEGLFCPLDKKNKYVTNWAAFASGKSTYQILETGLSFQTKNPYIRCPFHSFTLYANNTIESSSGSPITRLATRWVDENNLSPLEASAMCVDNLKNIGLSFRIWGGNHEAYPQNLSTNKGGSLEYCSRGIDGFDANAAMHFSVMSNELDKPKILVCPADKEKHIATDSRNIRPMNVSYRLRSGSNVYEDNPDEVLAECPIHRHILLCDSRVIDK